MKKGILWAAVFMSLICVQTAAFAAVSHSGANGFGQPKVPAGEYRVLVFDGNEWITAGTLRYNQFFREQSLDLTPYLAGEKSARVRLRQKGGGAAHIDAVILGGQSPSVMTGCREINILKKVGRKDHDVIDAFGKEFDFKFIKLGNDKTLRLTARVEPEIISKTPFQFPHANLYKKIDESSRFYTYNFKTPQIEQAHATPSEEDLGRPFFREYCKTGSGHPSAFTYGWVDHDDRNLYVRIDFTPDNTFDGNKDYAAVHVKTAKGLKSYKVSETENTWGSPKFSYTSKAKYQHKIYEFKIPLSDLGLSRSDEPEPIGLAFSAYGTASPPDNARIVETGDRHTLAIMADGTLWAWGENWYGQLGDGTNQDQAAPVQVGTDTDWVMVAAGGGHSVALKSDGTLWAWGWNYVGQLGDGTIEDKAAPVRVGTDMDWVAISAGYRHTIGLKSDGTLWGWGYNIDGQLGDGTTDNKTTPVQIGSETDWETVVAGDAFTMALKSDGTLWAWGRNSDGQLGDGTTENRFAPVQVGSDTDWWAVSAGVDHAMGLKSNGTLWAWGYNGDGQLGNGTFDSSTVPIQIGSDGDWVEVSAGNTFTLGSRSDGSLWAWGWNRYGQLGDGTLIDRNTPVQVGTDTDWSAVSAGSADHTAALKSDDTLWAWGHNEYGQLGIGVFPNKNAPARIGTVTNWAEISAGGSHTAGLKGDGTAWSWGANYSGELGLGTNVTETEPQQIGAESDWSGISVGNQHTLGLKSPGTLWAWGHNYYGQLGDGTTVSRTAPVQIGTDTIWTVVCGGYSHSVALKSPGTLWSWGENIEGLLGDGTTVNKSVPVRIGTDSDWSAIAASSRHTVALKSDDTLWAWGSNWYGQLGDGTTVNKSVPVRIGTDSDWSAIAAGAGYTVALKSDGTLWAWGDNSQGQLGDGTTVNKNAPVQIGLDADWAAISSWSYHTVALKTNGTLWAWGKNNLGQLGDGTTQDRLVPVQIGSDIDWTAISAGSSYTMGLKSDGSLWAWGANQSGQLGDGSIWKTSPVLIVDANSAIDTDGDGLLDSVETNTGTYVDENDTGTNPNNPDSDGDWVRDGDEVANGTDPTLSASFTPAGTGAIRGTVKDTAGVPITGIELMVEARTVIPCTSWDLVQSVPISTIDGRYVIVNLPPNSYYLRSNNLDQSDIVNEWWANPSGSLDCDGAQAVSVDEGGMVHDTDFYLEAGGIVSGTVTISGGGPIAGLSVIAQDSNNGQFRGGTQTQSDGSYVIRAVAAGNHLVRVSASGTPYATEWYRDAYTTAAATPVVVLAGEERLEVDFALEAGGSISGTVRDVADNPIAGVRVYVNEYDTNSWLGDAQTLSDGAFTVDGLPAGSYRVHVDTTGTSFASEYYNNAYDYGAATPVPVTAGENTPVIDFALEAGVSISGRVTSSFTGVDLPDLWVTALDYQTGEWRGNAQTQANGTYTISNLPPDIYKVNVDTNGTEFAFEFYGDTNDFNAAKRVDLTSAGTINDIDIALEGNFRIDPSVMKVREADGSERIYVVVSVLDFPGILPDDIHTLDVEGPPGFTPLNRADFSFTAQWNEFSTVIDIPPGGSMPLGVYNFSVGSGNAGRTGCGLPVHPANAAGGRSDAIVAGRRQRGFIQDANIYMAARGICG